MEKVKLNSDTVISIVTNGISSTESKLMIKMVDDSYTLADIDIIFSSDENTKKIALLSDSDELLKTYNGYDKNISCEIRKNAVIGYDENGSNVIGNMFVVCMEKTSDLEERVKTLEASQLDQDAAILDIAESVF